LYIPAYQVGGLRDAVRPEEIQESFARAGAKVEGVELMRDADGACPLHLIIQMHDLAGSLTIDSQRANRCGGYTGRSKGFAYMEVADAEGAEKCECRLFLPTPYHAHPTQSINIT